MDKTKTITKDKTILSYGARESRGEADGTRYIQAGKLVVIVHLSFGILQRLTS